MSDQSGIFWGHDYVSIGGIRAKDGACVRLSFQEADGIPVVELYLAGGGCIYLSQEQARETGTILLILADRIRGSTSSCPRCGGLHIDRDGLAFGIFVPKPDPKSVDCQDPPK